LSVLFKTFGLNYDWPPRRAEVLFIGYPVLLRKKNKRRNFFIGLKHRIFPLKT